MGNRMTIDSENKTEHKTLSIQVRLDGFSFYVKNGMGNTLGKKKSFSFKEVLNPEKCLTEIKRIVKTRRFARS